MEDVESDPVNTCETVDGKQKSGEKIPTWDGAKTPCKYWG